jgi:glycosyltransferase involved in cell wall biosynthesis
MKVSIITICYNRADTIRDTFESVLSQTYSNFEYIVVDGASQDNTVEIIKQYEPLFQGRMRWLSEKDKGIYDAMNKGIQMATGDIIGILNSDDFYMTEDAIESIVDCFVKTGTDSVYAQLYCVSENNTDKIIRDCTYKSCKRSDFFWGWHPPHPAFFVKKKVYEDGGLFDTKYRIASDYDLMLRFFIKERITSVYLKKYIMKMRLGGISQNKRSFKLKRYEEIQILKQYYHYMYFIPFLLKPLVKLYQYKF